MPDRIFLEELSATRGVMPTRGGRCVLGDCGCEGAAPTTRQTGLAISSLSLGALGEFQGSVKQAVYTAPVLSYSGPDLGAEAIQNRLNADIWQATVIPQLGNPSSSWWGSTTFPDAKLKVTLKHKDGIAFDPDVGQKVVADASSAYATKLKAFSEWAVQITEDATSTVRDLAPTEVAGTAGKYWVKKIDDVKRIGLGPAFGLPGWFFPAVSVVGGSLLAIKLKKEFWD